ncbi:daunorubicin/doxorubicin resistance ABC transporter ATP-binding protein DrrA [Spongiactinospora rosea]|uniref:Daunorubicin/doxorubicin resistance ABC transporter ATP-binding protein DrrA n=1 Tax=Spongiactinospora rosea TaxID=2248750 RepID=A0A366LSW8_9ACTN|nr:ATP-binding cassette domain-containing protein [Spongiactinospora rosea]RBQ16710.1 daunorubicin/doxorubicin resistance ABC transporter ATP-binding protein DrrA [Spongiactinospora rosea]
MSDSPCPAVLTEGLRKSYRGSAALDGLDLDVPAGAVCGLLGPNGAGKTTAVRILSTLLRADAGRALVAGIDVARDPAGVRRSIGLVGQHAAVDEQLSGRQNLEMFARLSHLGSAAAARRADELLERFGLAGTGRKPAGRYSGGMRRRLDLAAGLILRPKVLFLDEPTTGLDPGARNEMWDAVRDLVASGTTVLLTTQYLEEADRLAGMICVIDHGRVIARGTPEELKSQIGGDRIDVVVRERRDLAAVTEILAKVGLGEPHAEPAVRRVSVPVEERVAALGDLTRALRERDIAAEDIAVRRPTLDEVFLTLTGGRS